MTVQNLLRQAVDEIKRIYPKYDEQKAFENLIAYMSIHLGATNYFLASPKVTLQTVALVSEMVDLARHSIPHDYLSDMAQDLGFISKEQDVNPHMLKYLDGKITTISLKASSNFVSCFNQYGKNVVYFCTESNLLSYHIALNNKKLYDIPGMILYVTQDIDTSLGATSWHYANTWLPPWVPQKQKKASKKVI